MKKEVSVVYIMWAIIFMLYNCGSCGHSDTLNDYIMEIHYTNGDKESIHLNNVSEVWPELMGMSYKITYFICNEHGYKKYVIGNVTHFKLKSIRSYENKYQIHYFFKYIQYIVFVSIIIVIYIVWYRPKKHKFCFNRIKQNNIYTKKY